MVEETLTVLTLASELLLLLLLEVADWSGLNGGGEWAVGVAWLRGRGSSGWTGRVSLEGVTWKRPTLKAGAFFTSGMGDILGGGDTVGGTCCPRPGVLVRLGPVVLGGLTVPEP